jgi:hypothetical protein
LKRSLPFGGLQQRFSAMPAPCRGRWKASGKQADNAEATHAGKSCS